MLADSGRLIVGIDGSPFFNRYIFNFRKFLLEADAITGITSCRCSGCCLGTLVGILEGIAIPSDIIVRAFLERKFAGLSTKLL